MGCSWLVLACNREPPRSVAPEPAPDAPEAAERAPTVEEPEPPPDPTLRLATGGLYNCFIDDARAVQCWGLFHGHSTNAPTPVTQVKDAVEVVSGYHMACARTGEGKVWCWNEDGVEPVDLPPATSIAVGQQYACAALHDGTVRCWSATLPSAGKLPPTPILYMEDAVEVAAGFYNACARSRGGEVRCWGEDHHGSVGADGRLPVFNQGNARDGHWAAHLFDDEATARVDLEPFWPNAFMIENAAAGCGKELGPIESTVLVEVQMQVGKSGAVEKVLSMTPSDDALAPTGNAERDLGPFQQCAQDAYLRHAKLVPVGKERTVSALLWVMPETRARLLSHHVTDDAVELDSRGYFSCAVKRDHTVHCWGITHGFDGPGIHGTRLEAMYGAAPVPDVEGFETISVGWRHLCGRRTSGAFACFGGNGGGEMGVQPHDTGYVVRDIAEPGTYAHVAAGPTLGCGLTLEGQVLCWGNNDGARLGIGHDEGGSHPPTPVAGLPKAAPIPPR